MNDFTKEELIIMYHNFSDTEFRGTNDKLNSIRQKIKSMIDNYCEHGLLKNLVCLECTNNPEKYKNE